MAPWHTKNLPYATPGREGRGFTLFETIIALSVLGMACSGIFVAVERSMDATHSLILETRAFEVASENLEQVLSSPMIAMQVEQGTSERYPMIEWETVIETFSPPAGSLTWVQAISRAMYRDHNDEEQVVELIHWLTHLTEQQLAALEGVEGTEDVGQTFEMISDAADYAGVSVDDIEAWLDLGLLQTSRGEFISHNLDIFIRAGGRPTDEELAMQIDAAEDPNPEDETEETDIANEQGDVPMEEDDGLGTAEPR
ncbi:prepilin-type N-terminal cleavage/methylation domain-containing protein [Planctomycetota bacterium]